MPAGRSICLPHHSLLSLLCPHRNDIYKKNKSINNTEVKCIFYAFDISFSYLFADRPHHRHGEWADVAPTQVFALPLVTEELQLSLLLIIQTVTVAHLDEDHMPMKPREHELERWQKMDGWMNEYYLKWIEVVFFLRFQYLYNVCQVSDWSQSWINCHHVFVIAKKCWYCALLLLGANCESGLTRNHVTKRITGSQIAADETTDQSD